MTVSRGEDRMGCKVALLTLGVSVAIGSTVGAQGQGPGATNEWPQWHGPDRNAISKETGLLKKWPETGPRLVWETTGLGRGFSSVAIAAGKIFTMGDRGDAQYVIALDRTTRTETWAAKVGKPWKDGPRCTPTFHQNLLYALGAHGDLVCVDANTGAVRWRKNFAKDFGGAMMTGWGYAESPLVDGNRLVCTPGGKAAALVALDRRTGALIWKTALPDLGPRGKDGAGYTSMVVGELAGVRQYVQVVGRGVVGVAAADGRFLWGYNKIANDVANIPTPILHGDHVFCTTSYKTGSALLKLTPSQNNGIRAEEVYFLGPRDFENHHGGVVLVDGYLYGGHAQNRGFPTCVSLKTGKVQWKQEPGPGRGSAAVVYADGHLYFRYEKGVLALIEATPEAYRLKREFALPERPGPGWSHPVILDGELYLRHDDVLMCYRLKADAAARANQGVSIGTDVATTPG